MVHSSPTRRLLLVQFAGDFREADRVLRETGQETYYNHRHILETLAETQRSVCETAIMCCRTPERYKDRLSSGVTVIGAGADPYQDVGPILEAIRQFDPTHIIFLGPMSNVIAPCLDSGTRVACIWADSFPTGVARTILFRRRIRRQLNDPRVEWVANHGRNACRSLVGIGVDPRKVFAWDFLHDEDPEEYSAKHLSGGQPPRLFFAGIVVESKGVYDLVDAVADLRGRGLDARARIAGAGEDERLRERVVDLALSDAVEPLGLLSNADVLAEMRAATAVVIPSRHDYPEGQPLTINEALRARTPIVASDHPVFRGLLVEGESAVTFPAGRPKAMAQAVERLHGNEALYERLSVVAPRTWRQMAVGVKWGDVVHRWARDSPEDRAWFAEQPGEFVSG